MHPRLIWGATGLLLVALFVSLRFIGSDALASGPELCLFRRTTGVACPACGLTRAAGAAAGGEFRASFAFHPLFGLVALEIAIAWGLWGRALRGAPLPRRALAVGALATAVLLLVLWGIRFAAGALPE